jgi:hypothetical protein
MRPYVVTVEIIVSAITVFIPVAVMTEIVWVPVTVISAIVIRVPGTPRTPVARIIVPAENRVPDYISGEKEKPDQRPCGNLQPRGSDHCFSSVSGIGCHYVIVGIVIISIDGFNDIVFAVKRLITDQLYLCRTVVETLNGKDGHILAFVPVDCNL